VDQSIPNKLLAQDHIEKNATDTLNPENKVKVFGLPIFFITPDTRIGGGVGGILTFRSPTDPHPSNITFSLAYTQRKQLLVWFPYQVYFGKGKYVAFGEVGWFRFIYQFFGIGNNIDNDFVEKYSTDFPRIRATLLRNVDHGNAFGVRFSYDNFDITRYDSSGLLLQKSITGWQGGRSLGMGLVWWKDTRNNRFYPSSGWFIETSLYTENKSLGSSYQFTRLSIEAARYLSLGKRSILALHTTAIGSLGDPPFFNNQAFLGGTKRLRGYFEGKYRDDHLLLAQMELRQELFGRIGGVLFTGAGTVFGTRGETAKIRPNVGLGVRFQVDKKQKINIRADYGIGIKNQGFYLTFGESF
jgi:outer membrane protein assembly factor BamA